MMMLTMVLVTGRRAGGIQWRWRRGGERIRSRVLHTTREEIRRSPDMVMLKVVWVRGGRAGIIQRRERGGGRIGTRPEKEEMRRIPVMEVSMMTWGKGGERTGNNAHHMARGEICLCVDMIMMIAQVRRR
jgi:hypothetical protein